MSAHLLKMEHIEHSYQRQHPVLRNFSFHVARGEIACLLGMSGCGKTTALRIIAGFERIKAGSVQFDGQTLIGPGSFVAPEKRNIGVVFQNAALFPHLSVAKNIAFGLGKINRDQRQQKVAHLLDLIGLAGLGERYPHELSGGQQQRVALARAMAPEPQLILLDEPFSNLDADLRQSLGADIRRLLKANGMSAVLVTHDQTEAFTMADRIAIMRNGQIEQKGSAAELFYQPASAYVAGFLGQGRFIQGQMQADGLVSTALGTINPIQKLTPGAVQVLLRPADVTLGYGDYRAKVSGLQFGGEHQSVELELGEGQTLLTQLPSQQRLQLGESVNLSLKERPLPTFELSD